MLKWLRFFRVVNLPTVPGDILVGAAAVRFAAGDVSVCGAKAVFGAAAAAVLLYMFGLADNDILGAPTDHGRPIAEGEISLSLARWARFLCLAAAAGVAAALQLPPRWWIMAALLTVSIAAYNRAKSSMLMGLCRGLDVLGGAAVATGAYARWPALAAAAVFTIYIAAVTRFSEGEELDPARKRAVGALIGALVYLQLSALIVFYLAGAPVRSFLLVGAALLILLRLARKFMPKVSAS